MKFWNKIKAVSRREMRVMRKRPVYLLASVGVMAFCLVFCLTFLKDRIPQDLPIGVVDYDRSSLSRNLIRQVDATRIGETAGFDSYTEARKALQTGKLTAFCVIPENFHEDVLSGRQPTLTLYVNTVYFIGGSLSYKELVSLMNMASGAVQMEVLAGKGMSADKIEGLVQPIRIDAHNIGNPAVDYRAFLTNALIPGMLETIIILLTVYAIGSELKHGTSRHLLEKSGGSMSAAMLGKMIPYTLLFTVMGIICDLVLYDWMGFHMAGSIWNMFLGTVLLVLASEAIGIFIIGCLPILRLAISISALFSMLAFSLTGFSLPVEAMPAGIRGLAELFPLRHFYEMYVQEAFYASGFGGWYKEVISLLVFLILPAFVYKRLHKAFVNLNFPRK